MRWAVGGSMLAIAAWTLVPDKFDGEVRQSTRAGLFVLTCVVFFSMAGFFHSYYLATLTPALGGMVGMGFSIINHLKEKNPIAASAIWLIAAGNPRAGFALKPYIFWEVAGFVDAVLTTVP